MDSDEKLNRTLDDIMEDYEGADSWETLLSQKDGAVVQFKCLKNGQHYFCIEYSEKFGEICLPEDIQEKLRQKTVEKQMEHFAVAESRYYYKTAYGEECNEKLLKHSVPLADYDGLVRIILHKNVIVGAMVKACFGDSALMFGRPVCVYYTSDNDGSGTNDREDYAYLLYQDEASKQD